MEWNLGCCCAVAAGLDQTYMTRALTWELFADDSGLSDTTWTTETVEINDNNVNEHRRVEVYSSTVQGDNATLDVDRTFQPLRFSIVENENGNSEAVYSGAFGFLNSPFRQSSFGWGSMHPSRFVPVGSHWQPGTVDSVRISPGFIAFDGNTHSETNGFRPSNVTIRMRAFRVWEDGVDITGVVQTFAQTRTDVFHEIARILLPSHADATTGITFAPKLGSVYQFDAWYQMTVEPNPSNSRPAFIKFCVGKNRTGGAVEAITNTFNFRIGHTPAADKPLPRGKMLEVEVTDFRDLESSMPANFTSPPLQFVRPSVANPRRYVVPIYSDALAQISGDVIGPDTDRISSVLDSEVPSIRRLRCTGSQYCPTSADYADTQTMNVNQGSVNNTIAQNAHGDVNPGDVGARNTSFNIQLGTTPTFGTMEVPTLFARGIWDGQSETTFYNYQWPQPLNADASFVLPSGAPDSCVVRVVDEMVWFDAKVDSVDLIAYNGTDGTLTVNGRLMNNDPRFAQTSITGSGAFPTSLAFGATGTFSVAFNVTENDVQAGQKTVTASWNATNEQGVIHPAAFDFVYYFNDGKLFQAEDVSTSFNMVSMQLTTSGFLRNHEAGTITGIAGEGTYPTTVDSGAKEPFSFVRDVDANDLATGSKRVVAYYSGQNPATQRRVARIDTTHVF